ncbi:MAG: hypothetical protein FWH29_11050 [Methanobrevibacter sp.]|nr:hypothetical protein [Methanobrevibacter sp.]
MTIYAKKLRIKMNDRNTYTYNSIIETFGVNEAVKRLSKVRFYKTPKQAN